MKQLICEMCRSTDMMKEDGAFVCQSCGAKYSVEEAKKMVSDEANSDSSRTGEPKMSQELSNLYQIARRAKGDDNSESAAKYYDMILIKDPTSWEASFYVVYFKAMQCKIAQIKSAGNSIANCIETTLNLIKDNVTDEEEQRKAYTEVSNGVIRISTMLVNAAANHYAGISSQIRGKYKQEWIDNTFASILCMYVLGNCLDTLFHEDSAANLLSIAAWKQGIAWHQTMITHLADKEKNRNTVNKYAEKVWKHDASYALPEESKGGGCYVATAVYGSYDCPQVWTLRRYRDYKLAETWYGRAFIRTYYAVSPTLVKWFGETEWFKKMWQGKLDRMVDKLQKEGFESTPYEDKNW